MKTRALLALAALALCLAVGTGFATADQTATATLTTNGTPVGFVHIEAAPQGVFTVWENVAGTLIAVGSGVVGPSGIADVPVTILYSPEPSFLVRLRPTSGGMIILAIPQEPDPYWWWD